MGKKGKKEPTKSINLAEDKKLEAFITLAESCWKEFDTRRSYEWKVSFGLWTAIGIMIGFALKEDISFPFSQYYLLIPIPIIFLTYIFFHWGLHKSGKYDQEKRHIYINSFIHPLIDFDINKVDIEKREYFNKPKTSKLHFLLKWSHGSQILITLVFLTVLGIIIGFKDFTPKRIEAHKCQSCEKKRACVVEQPSIDIKSRIVEGEKFKVVFNGPDCPLDDGWNGANDPLGTILCGMSYEVQYKNKSWIVTGLNESTYNIETHIYTNANIDNNEISIWGVKFTFNKIGELRTKPYGFVGRIEF